MHSVVVLRRLLPVRDNKFRNPLHQMFQALRHYIIIVRRYGTLNLRVFLFLRHKTYYYIFCTISIILSVRLFYFFRHFGPYAIAPRSSRTCK